MAEPCCPGCSSSVSWMNEEKPLHLSGPQFPQLHHKEGTLYLRMAPQSSDQDYQTMSRSSLAAQWK